MLAIWRAASCVLPLLFVFGCTDNSNNTGQIDAGNDSSKGEFAIPQSISAAALPNTPGTSLLAYITVDSQPRQEMTINHQRTQASITLSSLSVGQHTFKIEFYFQKPGYLRQLLLIDGQITRDLVAGQNDLTFSESDYNPPYDSDGDGKSNIDEAVAGTNPFSCLVGIAHVGDCQL